MIFFNDVAAAEIIFENPRSGQWVADLRFSGLTNEEKLKLTTGTKSKMVLDFEEQYWIGTIVEVTHNFPDTNIRIIAGDGKMNLPTKAKQSKVTNGKQISDAIVEDTTAAKPQQSLVPGPVIPPLSEQEKLLLNLTKSSNQKVAFQAALAWNFLEKKKEEKLKRDQLSALQKANQENDNKELLGLISNTNIEKWQKLENVEAGKQLDKSIKASTKNQNATWRINRDGNIVYTTDTNTSVRSTVPTSAQLLSTKNSTAVFQVYDLDYYPEPGSWFEDDSSADVDGNINIWRVEHVRLTGDSKRLTVKLFQVSPTNNIKSIVNKIHEEAYQRSYSANIHRQNSDGTLDLLPDDALIKGTGLANIPIRAPLGFSFSNVPADARAIVQYENNDPSKPYVVGFVQLDASEHNASNYYLTIGNTSNAVPVAKATVADERLDALETKLNDLITKYNAHIHTTTATVGATATVGVISATTSTETSITAGESTAVTRLKVE
jgi:hypothetical protein